MSKVEKLIEKLKSRPKDFTWDEMLKVLNYFGFEQLAQGKTGGSRRKFVNRKSRLLVYTNHIHKKVLKLYQLDIIINYLKL